MFSLYIAALLAIEGRMDDEDIRVYKTSNADNTLDVTVVFHEGRMQRNWSKILEVQGKAKEFLGHCVTIRWHVSEGSEG